MTLPRKLSGRHIFVLPRRRPRPHRALPSRPRQRPTSTHRALPVRTGLSGVPELRILTRSSRRESGSGRRRAPSPVLGRRSALFATPLRARRSAPTATASRRVTPSSRRRNVDGCSFLRLDPSAGSSSERGFPCRRRRPAPEARRSCCSGRSQDGASQYGSGPYHRRSDCVRPGVSQLDVDVAAPARPAAGNDRYGFRRSGDVDVLR